MRCLGGYVYDLDFAPQNKSLLAVAVGDKMIRIWNGNDKRDENKHNDYVLNAFYDLNVNKMQKDRKGKYKHKKRQKQLV